MLKNDENKNFNAEIFQSFHPFQIQIISMLK
jgi:hypothetical protein